MTSNAVKRIGLELQETLRLECTAATQAARAKRTVKVFIFEVLEEKTS